MPVIRKRQLAKENLNCRKPAESSLRIYMEERICFKHTYDFLSYKTYRRNDSKYYFGKEGMNQLTE